ncbi:hypothetical protein JCM16496A_39240 [Bacteroides rodentium JCM 16496]
MGEMLQQSQNADGWGKKTLQRLAVDLKNGYADIKGVTVRNMQYIVQFFNEYNQELTMVKEGTAPITKSLISQLDEYNFTLPIKHLDWTHNLILIKQVKDICARYWYMVQSITNHWTTRYLQVQKVRPPEPFLTEHAINNGIFREFANRNIAQPIFGKG